MNECAEASLKPCLTFMMEYFSKNRQQVKIHNTYLREFTGSNIKKE